MALEWNINSVNEFCLKIEIASAVKMILNEVKGDKDLLFSLYNIKTIIGEKVDRIRDIITDTYNQANYYEEIYEEIYEEYVSDLDEYNRDIEYCSEIRKLAPVNLDDIEYIRLDDFECIVESDHVVKLVKYDWDWEGAKACMGTKRYLKISIEDDILSSIKMLEEKEKEEVIRAISGIILVDVGAYNISKNSLELYCDYDIEVLNYNLGGYTYVYQAYKMAEDIIWLTAVKEYIKGSLNN